MRKQQHHHQVKNLKIQTEYSGNDDIRSLIEQQFQSSRGFQKATISQCQEEFNSFTTPKVCKQIMTSSSKNFHLNKLKQYDSEKMYLTSDLVETFKGSKQFDERKLIKLFDVILAKVNFAENVSASLCGTIKKHKWDSLIVLDYYLIAYRLALLNICLEISLGREPDQFFKTINYFPPSQELFQGDCILKLQSQISNMQENSSRDFKYANRFMERFYSVEPVKFNYLHIYEKASNIIKEWLHSEIKSINESKQFMFACTLYKFSQFEQLIPMSKFEDISISTIGYVDESDESLQFYTSEIAITK